jgi:hypothetical protein
MEVTVAVQGLVKLRKHQFGKQSAMNTPVAAKRAYPFSGVPSVDLTWTDPEVDQGSIAPVSPPYRGSGEFTASLDDPAVKYNDLPIMFAGVFAGTASPTTTSTSEAWVWTPSPNTVVARDVFTYQFGDDVVTDWFQLYDGLIETLEITGTRDPDGPCTASISWRFGAAASTGSTDSPVSGTVPTAGLTVATTDVMVYLKDGAIYIASDPDDIDTSQITDALHAFTHRITNEYDLKRYANGEQTFNVDEYALASQLIELEATWAKTSDTVGTGSESDAWFSDTSVTRYIKMAFVSTEEASAAVPYSWDFTMAGRYYTREEGEAGGNTVIVLNAHAFWDADADVPFYYDTHVTNTVDETTL